MNVHLGEPNLDHEFRMNETSASVVSHRVHVGECLACVLYVGEVLNGPIGRGIVRHMSSLHSP